MPATFSTWGQWDDIRKMLKQTILNHNEIVVDKNELKKLLLGEVVTTMLDESNLYIKNNLHRWKDDKKGLIMDSYGVCLGAIVRVLKEKLNLSDEQKKLLMPSIEQAHNISSTLIESIQLIGDFSFNKKNELLADKYGSDFATLYPHLVNGVYVYDVELSKEIWTAVLAKTKEVASKETPINKKRLKAQAIFMDEIIEQRASDPDFENTFKQETGQTMEDYKEGIILSFVPQLFN